MQKLSFLFILVIFVTFLGANYDPRSDLLESRNYDTLLNLSRTRMVDSGDSADNLFFLGAAYYGLGRSKLADVAFTNCLSYEDYDYKMASFIANYYNESKQDDKLFTLYTRMSTKFPDHVLAIYEPLGEMHYEKGNYAKAAQYLSKVVESSEVAVIHYGFMLGISYKHIEKLPEAEQVFRLALASGEKSEELYRNLAEVMFGQQKYEGAIEFYRNASEVSSKEARAEYYYKMGTCYKKLDNNISAAKAFRDAIDQGLVSAEALVDYAQSALAIRNHAGVVQVIQPYADEYQENGEIQYLLANAYDGLGQRRQALDYYQRALGVGHENRDFITQRIQAISTGR